MLSGSRNPDILMSMKPPGHLGQGPKRGRVQLKEDVRSPDLNPSHFAQKNTQCTVRIVIGLDFLLFLFKNVELLNDSFMFFLLFFLGFFFFLHLVYSYSCFAQCQVCSVLSVFQSHCFRFYFKVSCVSPVSPMCFSCMCLANYLHACRVLIWLMGLF